MDNTQSNPAAGEKINVDPESLIKDSEAEAIAVKADAMIAKNAPASEGNISEDENIDENTDLKNIKSHPSLRGGEGPGIAMPPMPTVPASTGIRGLGPRVPDSRSKGDAIKYSDYIRQEKMRTFKRLPKLVGKRSSVPFTCPSCKKDGDTQTNKEITGTQICMCITTCWLGGYVCCAIPFCCPRMYNIKHSCPKCYY